jgi:hypothetical protein
MAQRTLIRLGVLVLGFGLLYGGLNVADASPPTQTVQVTNTPAEAVPVQEQGTVTVSSADNPALQPVEVTHGGPTSTGGPGLLYTVPSGKELVIDQVSASSQQPNDAPVPAALMFVNSGPDTLFRTNVPLAPTWSSASETFFVGSQQTQFYAPPGSNLVCNIFNFAVGPTILAYCSFAGHLVDLPS